MTKKQSETYLLLSIGDHSESPKLFILQTFLQGFDKLHEYKKEQKTWKITKEWWKSICVVLGTWFFFVIKNILTQEACKRRHRADWAYWLWFTCVYLQEQTERIKLSQTPNIQAELYVSPTHDTILITDASTLH